MFEKFDSATSKSLATSHPNNNNNSRMSTDTPMDVESLQSINNAMGDDDCIVQRVDNVNKDGSAAMLKDG